MPTDSQSQKKKQRFEILHPFKYRGTRYPAGHVLEFEINDPETEAFMRDRLMLPVEEPVKTEPAPPAENLELPGKPNLNRMTLEQVLKLTEDIDGIGPASARAIFDNRPYGSLEEVPTKAGLSNAVQAVFPKFADRVVV